VIGSRLGAAPAPPPRVDAKPSGRDRVSRRTRARTQEAPDAERTSVLPRARPKGRARELSSARLAGTRFRSRASGRVGQRRSRGSARRSHTGRRFTLVVLALVVVVLLALLLIDGSSNDSATPASSKATPVAVPAGAVAAPAPAPPTPTTPAATVTTTAAPPAHHAAAPPAKHKARANPKAAAHKAKPPAHKSSSARTHPMASSGAAASPAPSSSPALSTSSAPTAPAPVRRYVPPPPARQSLSGLGALSGGTSTLSHRRAHHRKH
jgi:hypothetical protein